MLLIRWFLSRRVRHAVDVCRQVRKLVRAQQDLLQPAAVAQVQERLHSLWEVLRRGSAQQEIQAGLKELERVVDANLRAYPNPGWRENLEVFLVTGAVVLALRTFFFQPMAIPSGSAQPTLWGIHKENLKGRRNFQAPGPVQRFVDNWWSGIRYYHKVAREGGTLDRIGRPRWAFFFLSRQTLQIGPRSYTFFYSSSLVNLAEQAGLVPGMQFASGEDIINMKVTSGDHLFVNRMVYNFRHPRRGEIIVFSSRDLSPPLIADTHYIKRLVGLPNEHVRIGNDRHLIIDGKRLDASTPGFEMVYGFNPKQPPRDSQYSGHVNNWVARHYLPYDIALRFPDENTEFVIRPDHYLVIGDNTMNSHDGRAWGDFPREKVIGRASFVFWPISSRFGWGYR